MKTPPRYLLNPALKPEGLEKRENKPSNNRTTSDRSKWDNLSSVDQKMKENLPQAVTRDTQVGPMANPNGRENA